MLGLRYWTGDVLKIRLFYFNIILKLFALCTVKTRCSVFTLSDAAVEIYIQTSRWQGVAKSPLRKVIRQKQLVLLTFTFHIKLHSRALMEEKRFKCFMMLQIHRSDTTSIDAVINRVNTTASRRLNFLIWPYTCTSVHCTVQ